MAKLIGFTETETTCGCCGKTDLKGTYQFDNGMFYGSECAKNVTGVSSETLKIAKIKSEYNLIAFNENPRVKQIQKMWVTAPIANLKNLKAELKQIKEQYKKAA